MASVRRDRASFSTRDIGNTTSSRRNTDDHTQLSSVDHDSSSDKENHDHRQPRTSLGKRKSTSRIMSSPQAIPGSARDKRRRLETGHGGEQSEAAHRREIAKDVDKSFYDPDQDEGQKRVTLKRLRDLNSKLQDSRSEYVHQESRGIQETIREADELIKDVKQTSIATVDSRLLVNVGDLAYKKINTLTLGDTSSGIDVDDFISKCISFMRQTPADDQGSATQRRRRHPQHGEEDDEEDDAVDLNWARFGRRACFPNNSRPCLSGFLLGPLSVRKKVRQLTQRRAPQSRVDPSQIVRPVEMTEEERDKQESASLTDTCQAIAKLLTDAQTNGEAAVRAEVDELPDDAPDEEINEVLRKHHLSDTGGVPLFDFCVNPKSFGQTIENFFYVSFLIKEGKVGLEYDNKGMPSLGIAQEKTMKERQETPRNQAVFTLDFDTWEELISSHGIEKSIIPHRIEQEWEDGVIRPEAVIPPNERSRASSVESEDMYG